MRQGRIIAGALITLVLLTILSVESRRTSIESDLVYRAEAALQGAGLGMVQVAAEGRDLRLKGRLSSASQEANAISLVEDVWGVRIVKNQLQIKLPPLQASANPAPLSSLLQEPSPAAQPCGDLKNALKGASGRILFLKNSIQLSKSDRLILESLAKDLKRCPNTSFQVQGHTDSRGKAQHNRALSESRARVVVAELKRLGVKVKRAEAKGYGESQPIASNKNAAGRSKNRRIDFKLLGS